MCRLLYYDNRKGFDKFDKRILLRLATNAYEHSNTDGFFVGFDNGMSKRTMSFKELTKFIIKNSEGSKSCMMHLRLATHGKGPTCVHGWEFQYKNKGKKYLAAHNGVFYDNDLGDESFVNDSYTFFKNVFNSKKIISKKNVLSRLEEYIEEQGGAGVIGLYNKNETIMAGIKTELYPVIIKRKDGINTFLVISKKDILDFTSVKSVKSNSIEYGGYTMKFDSTDYVDIDYNIEKQIINEKGIKDKFLFISNGKIEINDDEFKTSYSTSSYNTGYTSPNVEEEKEEVTPDEKYWIEKYQEDFPDLDKDAQEAIKEAGATSLPANSNTVNYDMSDDVWHYDEIKVDTVRNALNAAFKRDQLGKIEQLDSMIWAKSLSKDDCEYWTVMKLGEALYAEDIVALKYVDKRTDIFRLAKRARARVNNKTN